MIFFARPTGVAGWIGAAVVVGAIYFGMTGKKQYRVSIVYKV
ncbi:MAG: hypothetical protein RBR67_09065 [Desulfobacterium sp.]|nr:hypothetical protein [Desulfobacterium sp.]